MRWVWRGLGLVAMLLVLVVLVGGGYGYYRFIGVPFGFNAMLNTQATEEALRSPQLLSQVGFLDGGPLDFHSGKLDVYSLGERADLYARLKTYVAQIEAWDKSKLDPQEALSY